MINYNKHIITPLLENRLDTASTISGFLFFKIDRCLSLLTDSLSKAKNLSEQKTVYKPHSGQLLQGSNPALNSYLYLNRRLNKGCFMVAS